MANEASQQPSTPPKPEVQKSSISAPPSQLCSPSIIQSPYLAPATPRAPWTPQFMRTPLASPVCKAIVSMKTYLEEVGHLTMFDPQDAWLPITESRNGNAYYAAFHVLSSGIGFQALVLPVAFTFLGWTWGILCLSIAFIWQLYTLWLLIQLHESVPGIRYSRYLHLVTATFGPKLGMFLAKFPIMYLSAGNCTALIILGGGSMKLFFNIVCRATCNTRPLTTIEWYLVFICLAVVLAQLPNLNSIAGVSLIGSVTAVTYCTMIWVISVTKGRQPRETYNPVKGKSDIDQAISTLNSLGIIAFAFRGHNLVLEIQGTMPSTLKHPSHVPMWKGVKAAYLLIALCLYPIAIGGFWAYGNLIPTNGMLSALHSFHSHDTSRVVLGLTAMLVIVNCLCSFQIYAMPVFDTLESGYTRKHNKPCPRWLRSGFRAFFGSLSFLVAVALPFLSDLAGLLGGISLPITAVYPCFMWILIKKPERYSAMWNINLVMGSLGVGLSIILVTGGVWRIADPGIYLRFFKPQ